MTGPHWSTESHTGVDPFKLCAISYERTINCSRWRYKTVSCSYVLGLGVVAVVTGNVRAVVIKWQLVLPLELRCSETRYIKYKQCIITSDNAPAMKPRAHDANSIYTGMLRFNDIQANTSNPAACANNACLRVANSLSRRCVVYVSSGLIP